MRIKTKISLPFHTLWVSPPLMMTNDDILAKLSKLTCKEILLNRLHFELLPVPPVILLDF